jgi:hypothetical protein
MRNFRDFPSLPDIGPARMEYLISLLRLGIEPRRAFLLAHGYAYQARTSEQAMDDDYNDLAFACHAAGVPSCAF